MISLIIHQPYSEVFDNCKNLLDYIQLKTTLVTLTFHFIIICVLNSQNGVFQKECRNFEGFHLKTVWYELTNA